VRVRLYSQGIVVNHHSGMAGLNFERARAELELMRLYECSLRRCFWRSDGRVNV
jgi:hypothetical protein